MYTAHNTSSAYKYEPDEKYKYEQNTGYIKAVKGRRKRQNAQMQKQNRLFYRLVNRKSICAFLIIAAVSGVVVSNYVELHELTSQISTLRSEIRQLENENIRLENQIEITITMNNIAEIAHRDLGLQHPTAHQTVYVSLFQESTIELTEQAPRDTLGARVRFGLSGALHRAQEYLGRP